MVSTLYVILFALIGIAMGYCGGIATAALMMAAKAGDEKAEQAANEGGKRDETD